MTTALLDPPAPDIVDHATMDKDLRRAGRRFAARVATRTGRPALRQLTDFARTLGLDA